MLRDFLDSQDFYELMQAYRHARVEDQKRVCECFETVKSKILENANDEPFVSEYDS